MPLKSSGSLEKWINIEYRNMNKNLVARQIVLSELLQEDAPAVETRDGEEYKFDAKALKNLADKLPKEILAKLKVPIFFYFTVQVGDSCYLTDDTAFEALKITSDLNPMYRFREGKLWVSKPIAYEIQNKYPTLVQFVMH
jgi:uncharacterized protein (UPF0216 family)